MEPLSKTNSFYLVAQTFLFSYRVVKSWKSCPLFFLFFSLFATCLPGEKIRPFFAPVTIITGRDSDGKIPNLTVVFGRGMDGGEIFQ